MNTINKIDGNRGLGKKLYICWSYHHLLVAISKVLGNKEKSDILIMLHNHVVENGIIEKIQKSAVFMNVYSFNEDDVPWDISKRNVLKYGYYRYGGLVRYYKKICNVPFEKYNEIYSFFDCSSIGAYFHMTHIEYHLIEDAKQAFTNRMMEHIPITVRKQIYHPSTAMGFLIHIGYVLPIFGTSKYCKDIEVNSLEDLYLTEGNKNKFICVPETEYFGKLDSNSIKSIIDIFSPDFNLDLSQKYNLLLTEPLAADGKVKNKAQQLCAYKKVIERIGNNYPIVIKPHPRDDFDYSVIESYDLRILPRTFPSEILTLIPNECFNHYYGIGTGAIYSFPEEKRTLFGYELLKEFENLG